MIQTIEANLAQDKTVAVIVRQGYEQRLSITLEHRDGTDFDPAGYSWAFRLATNYADQDGMLVREITATAGADGDVVTATHNGLKAVLEILLSKETTAMIPHNRVYVWELRGTAAGAPVFGLDGTIASRSSV